MRRRRTRFLPLLVVGIAFAALCAPSLMASQTAGWSVAVANNAFVDHGKGDTAVPVAMGGTVAPGDRLTTGAGGALVLTRGEDLVTMAENSQIEIVNPQPTSTTMIEQPYGHVEYHVTKEKVPHFQVDAPLLATVVKGTTFSVDASESKSSVTVSEGRVEAKNRRTGTSAQVGAGQRGSIESRDRGVDVGAAPGKAASESAASSNANSSSTSSSSDSSSGGNSGKGNSGQGNSGNGNSDKGKGNSDHGNSGHGNSGGNGNSGNGNSGNGNSGNGNSGNGNNGNGNSGNSGDDGKGKAKGRNK
jgi:hypothetical protein